MTDSTSSAALPTASLAGTGLTAVVTGASSGIGAATARRLAAEGWMVVATARRAERLAELDGVAGIRSVVADITDEAGIAALVEEATADGPVHALVNNAGGAFGLEPVAETDPAQWQRMYDINVLGALRVTQALLPSLRASGRGDLLFVTSVAAHGTYPGGAGYTGAKHAERMIAETLRQELQGEPIRVIEVAPGAVDTEEFSLNRFGGDAARAKRTYEGFEPLHAEDIAEAIAWSLGRPHHVNIDQLVIRPRAQVGAKTPSKPA